MILFIVYINDLSGPLNTDVLQRSLLDPILLSVYTTDKSVDSHTQIHISLHHSHLSTASTLSHLYERDSKISIPIFSPMVLSSFSPLFLTACEISAPSCLFKP